MNYISTGLVSNALLMLKDIKRFPDYDLNSLKIAHISYGVNIDITVSFILQCGWALNTCESKLVLTDDGDKILENFNGREIIECLWQLILKTYVINCKPAWSSRIIYGRNEAFIFMSSDEKRCFSEAGLMNTPPSENIVDWWDYVASEIREVHNLGLEETGRRGEKLTIEYEKNRTGRMPKWESIDSNLVGYDIISYSNNVSNRQLLIEVKSSSKPMDQAKMIISRREWNVANVTQNISSYLFYVWKLGKKNMLAKITPLEIKQHMPIEQGAGLWKEAELPYNIFEEKFVVV